jgi:hypothetical protein
MTIKLIGRCENDACGRISVLVLQRVHKIKGIGKVTSRTRMCWRCHRAVKSLVKRQDRESAS